MAIAYHRHWGFWLLPLFGQVLRVWTDLEDRAGARVLCDAFFFVLFSSGKVNIRISYRNQCRWIGRKRPKTKGRWSRKKKSGGGGYLWPCGLVLPRLPPTIYPPCWRLVNKKKTTMCSTPLSSWWSPVEKESKREELGGNRKKLLRKRGSQRPVIERVLLLCCSCTVRLPLIAILPNSRRLTRFFLLLSIHLSLFLLYFLYGYL